MDRGIRLPEDPIPVVPAAHYQCGGLLTDWDGRTSLAGLFAAGEVACTGVHGANRLASNSLLEAVVFSHRAAERLRTDLASVPSDARDAGHPPLLGVPGAPASRVEATVRDLMWENVGLVRSDEGLTEARHRLADLSVEGVATPTDPAGAMRAREAEFHMSLATLIVRCARRRLESRGLHNTESHPYRDAEKYLRDTVLVP